MERKLLIKIKKRGFVALLSGLLLSLSTQIAATGLEVPKLPLNTGSPFMCQVFDDKNEKNLPIKKAKGDEEGGVIRLSVAAKAKDVNRTSVQHSDTQTVAIFCTSGDYTGSALFQNGRYIWAELYNTKSGTSIAWVDPTAGRLKPDITIPALKTDGGVCAGRVMKALPQGGCSHQLPISNTKQELTQVVSMDWGGIDKVLAYGGNFPISPKLSQILICLIRKVKEQEKKLDEHKAITDRTVAQVADLGWGQHQQERQLEKRKKLLEELKQKQKVIASKTDKLRGEQKIVQQFNGAAVAIDNSVKELGRQNEINSDNLIKWNKLSKKLASINRATWTGFVGLLIVAVWLSIRERLRRRAQG